METALPKKSTYVSGQTLIGIILSGAIFAILAHAIFTLTTTSFRLVSFSRARIAARHIAQERIELIRNLPFDDVGTVGGIPAGNLEQNENVLRNGLNYIVKTAIVYIDDPFDQTAPDDLLPTDYKRVRVDVSWEGLAASRTNPVVLATDIAPKGIETTAGGGTLSILVFDANALAVAQTDVHILADSLDPVIDLELQTSDNGYLVLPGTPICVECYFIEVTKDGYSAVRTYSTTEVANPNKPYQSIIEGELTEVSFAIDKTSTLNIASVNDRDSGFSALGDITFNLQGTKTLGTDSDDFPVYKFNKQFTTDAGGNIIITDVEWDNYTITIPAGVSYDIAGTNPLIPLSLLPDTEIDWVFSLASDTAHSLLAAFTDSSTIPIASAEASLSDVPFEEIIFSGLEGDPDFGQAFFSNLSSGTFLLQATASGYLEFSGNVDVSGISREDVVMNPE